MKTLQLTNLRSYIEREFYVAARSLMPPILLRQWKQPGLAKNWLDQETLDHVIDLLGLKTWPLSIPPTAPEAGPAFYEFMLRGGVTLKTLDEYYTNLDQIPGSVENLIVDNIAKSLSRVPTPALALAIVELTRQLILHGENILFLDNDVDGGEFEWFISELSACSEHLTTEEAIALIQLITHQIKLRKPELVSRSKHGNENAVIRYMCTLAEITASKKRKPGKWNSFLKPQKEKTRHIIVSRTPKHKKSLMLVPGESTRDVQTMLFNNVGTLDSHWLLVERDRNTMKIIKERGVFPEDYINVHYHTGDYSTAKTSEVPPLDFVWLDQLGNFAPKQLTKVRDFNLDMGHLDFWITFNYFYRNNTFFPRLRDELVNHPALANEFKRIRMISDLDPKFHLNIITQWVMLNYVFEHYHFDTEVIVYADSMHINTPIYMVLFHLSNFTRRGRPFWATALVKKVIASN